MYVGKGYLSRIKGTMGQLDTRVYSQIEREMDCCIFRIVSLFYSRGLLKTLRYPDLDDGLASHSQSSCLFVQ